MIQIYLMPFLRSLRKVASCIKGQEGRRNAGGREERGAREKDFSLYVIATWTGLGSLHTFLGESRGLFRTLLACSLRCSIRSAYTSFTLPMARHCAVIFYTVYFLEWGLFAYSKAKFFFLVWRNSTIGEILLLGVFF